MFRPFPYPQLFHYIHLIYLRKSDYQSCQSYFGTGEEGIEGDYHGSLFLYQWLLELLIYITDHQLQWLCSLLEECFHTGHNMNGFSFSTAIAKCVLNGKDKRKTDYVESSMLRLPTLDTYQKHLPSYLTVKPESQVLVLFCVLVV